MIIGTAGHVDHGKTALVKALTGIDTDRLEEEKRRGVTIEPGFAYIDFDDGFRAGIIDVPGHERFIRNMLAGAGGIDLAMLVVAADEGVKPQTREHLGILTLLGISDGLVVVTKTDKVESDWLELVEEEITQLVTGTFLENRPFMNVSAFTGSGMTELRAALREIINKVKKKDVNQPFRLPVDRAFTVDGFGLVVTGTLIEGVVKVGDVAKIVPLGETASIRNVQVHDVNVDAAFAGQRTAICLAGAKRGSIKRGDVLCADGTLNTTGAIDVRLNVLPDSQRMIKNGAELHFYHGARTMLSKAFLLDKKELQHGESCYARLKLKEPLPCKRGDRFVVRFFSPLETIGGGVILDTAPIGSLSRGASAIEALRTREHGSLEEIAVLGAYELGGVFTETDLCRRADIDRSSCQKVVKTLSANGCVIQLSQGKYISAKVLEELGNECKSILGSYHASYPLRAGMNIAELRQKLFPGTETADANAVLNTLKDNGTIQLSDKVVALPDFIVVFTPVQSVIKDKLLAELTAAGYDVPAPDELSAIFKKNEKSGFEQVFESLISSGELVKLSPQVYWHRSAYDKAIANTRGFFEKNEEITLALCRDMLGTSRKYALSFLEHLDGKQVTKMQGETRRLAKGFDVLFCAVT